MTQEELSRLHTGDRITNMGSGYDYVVTSTFPVVATRTIGVTNPGEWVLSTAKRKPLSDAAATALALNGKDIGNVPDSVKQLDADNVVVVIVTEDYELSVHGAINDFASMDSEHAAELRIDQGGLIERPGPLHDESDEGVTDLRDHCEAWLDSPSIILDSEGNLSGSAVDLGHKFRQANGRAGVCIDLHLLPEGKP